MGIRDKITIEQVREKVAQTTEPTEENVIAAVDAPAGLMELLTLKSAVKALERVQIDPDGAAAAHVPGHVRLPHQYHEAVIDLRRDTERMEAAIVETLYNLVTCYCSMCTEKHKRREADLRQYETMLRDFGFDVRLTEDGPGIAAQ